MEKVDVPAVSFQCLSMKPEFSEKYFNQIDGYRKALAKQGLEQSEIDAQTNIHHGIYFSNQVPKLIPLMATIRLMPWLDSFENMEGGLVKRDYLMPLTLVKCSK